MIKKEITYEDFDGNTVTDVYYFNLSKAEVIELEMSERGGFAKRLEAIGESKDNKEIFEMFKKILLLTVGLRSEDGKRFIKTDEIRDAFVQSNAYSALILEFFGDANMASEFMRGVLPRDLGTTMDQLELPPPAQPEPDPDWHNMSKEEVIAELKKRQVIPPN